MTRLIITKAIPEATARVAALAANGFTRLATNTLVPYDNYYVR